MELTRRAKKKADRHKRILDTLRANAALRISELARDLGVSGETIRRDLTELGEDAKDFVRRKPGVAIGIAAAFGFLISRLFKGGSSED